jgi:hypothetical protein
MESCTAHTIAYLYYIKMVLRKDLDVSPVLFLHLHHRPVPQAAEVEVFDRSAAPAQTD